MGTGMYESMNVWVQECMGGNVWVQECTGTGLYGYRNV